MPRLRGDAWWNNTITHGDGVHRTVSLNTHLVGDRVSTSHGSAQGPRSQPVICTSWVSTFLPSGWGNLGKCSDLPRLLVLYWESGNSNRSVMQIGDDPHDIQWCTEQCFMLEQLKLKSTNKTKCWQGCRADGAFVHCWCEYEMVSPVWKIGSSH